MIKVIGNEIQVALKIIIESKAIPFRDRAHFLKFRRRVRHFLERYKVREIRVKGRSFPGSIRKSIGVIYLGEARHDGEFIHGATASSAARVRTKRGSH